MEVGLLGRVLTGLFFAAIVCWLWKVAAHAWWQKAFLLLVTALAIFFLTRTSFVLA